MRVVAFGKSQADASLWVIGLIEPSEVEPLTAEICHMLAIEPVTPCLPPAPARMTGQRQLPSAANGDSRPTPVVDSSEFVARRPTPKPGSF